MQARLSTYNRSGLLRRIKDPPMLLLLGLVLVSVLGHHKAWASATNMVDVSAALGLSEEREGCITSGWFDMDQDGHEEALWVDSTGIRYSHVDADGTLSLKQAEVVGETLASLGVTQRPILAAGDFDRDGERELMIIAAQVTLYDLVAPGKLVERPAATPPLPIGAFIADAAVGDLNRDGWPDVVLAASRFQLGHTYSKGAPDHVLMNRFGVFELLELLPKRSAETHSLTIADMNNDGLLDIVESVDFSGLLAAAAFSTTRRLLGPRILSSRQPTGPTNTIRMAWEPRWKTSMGTVI
jgi:hypothetical protein